jgi:hypothetical protein
MNAQHSTSYLFNATYRPSIISFLYLFFSLVHTHWPGSSVGIATDYGLDGPGFEKKIGLDGPGIEKKIPVGARFIAHVQTGSGAHPASCTMGTGSFRGVKRPGRGSDHSPPPSAEVENEWSYTSTSPLGPSGPVIGWPLPLPYPLNF